MSFALPKESRPLRGGPGPGCLLLPGAPSPNLVQVEGTVTDEQGNACGRFGHIKNVETGFAYSGVSRADGRYSFRILAGTYDISAEMTASPRTKKALASRSRQVPVDFQARPEAA